MISDAFTSFQNLFILLAEWFGCVVRRDEILCLFVS